MVSFFSIVLDKYSVFSFSIYIVLHFILSISFIVLMQDNKNQRIKLKRSPFTAEEFEKVIMQWCFLNFPIFQIYCLARN